MIFLKVLSIIQKTILIGEKMLFNIFGLILLAIFYGCYFIKMLIQKKQGIQTNQLGKGKMGTAKYIEISMQICSLLLPLVEIISIFMPLSNFKLTLITRLLGLVFSTSGTVFFVISVITMKNSWRAGVSESEKTELVTNGIYKISRNPAFLGFDLVYIGFVMMFFNWLLVFLSVITIILFHLQITKVEEPFLIKVFGSDYEEYKKSVCRYLGKKIVTNFQRTFSP